GVDGKNATAEVKDNGDGSHTITVKNPDGTSSTTTVKNGTNGVDGKNATATVTDNKNGTHTITVTNPDGSTTTTTVKDGAKGDKGEDGKSATAEVKDNGNGTHTVTVTNPDGSTTTTTVKDGAKGDKGDKGEDGKSPTAEVKDNGDGTHTVTVKNPDGSTTTATVKDGKSPTAEVKDNGDGTHTVTVKNPDGSTTTATVKDGKSPTAEVKDNGNGTHTVTVTNPDGSTTTATVKDGAKGDKGDKGEDGKSPTAEVKDNGDGTHTVTVKNPDGSTTTATVKDGKSPTAEVTEKTVYVDTDGNPVEPAKGADGQPKVGEDGKPVYVTKDGKEVPADKVTPKTEATVTITNTDGTTTTATVKDGKDGKSPTAEVTEKTVYVDTDGNPVEPAKGADGQPKVGEDGKPVYVTKDGKEVPADKVTPKTEATVTITNTDGTTTTATVKDGKDGKGGAEGPQGPKGDAGAGSWNIAENGKPKDVVNNNDTVSFVDGKGTTAVVENIAETLTNVTFNVDNGDITNNTDGSVTGPVTNANQTLEDANKALEDAKKALAELPANATQADKDAAQQAVENAQNVANEAQDAANKAGNKVATAQNVADAINKSGFNLTSSNNGENTSENNLVNPGDTVTIDGGKNVTVTQTKDANGNPIVSLATKDQVTFGEKAEPGKDGKPGKDGVDGSVGVNGKDGSAVVLNGKDGSIGLNGKDGKDGLTFKAADGAQGVDGTDGENGLPGKDGQTRIVYQPTNPDGTPKGKPEQIATLNDGLIFTGNNEELNRHKLNTVVKVVGEGVDKAASENFKSAAGNINVKANGTDTLEVQLAKVIDLTEDGSVTTGDTTVNNNGLTIKNGPSVTKAGVDAGDKKVTNVADGEISSTSKDAVNGSQLYNVIQNTGWDLTVDGNVAENTGSTRVANNGKATIKGGKNIVVSRKDSVVEVATSNNPEFDTVKVGNTTLSSKVAQDGVNELNVAGNNGAPTRITNVAPGVKGTDAVNVNQLKGEVNNINNKINRNQRESRAGIAGAAAIAGLPEIHLAGKSMVAAAASTYKGQNAVAVGYSRLSDNSKVKLKLSGSADTQGDFIGTVGVGYAW
ncbi:YadA-like family protein, partial [Mannheimia sp. HC-2023]